MRLRIPILTALAMLALAASAQAQTTIGQLAPAGSFECNGPFEYDEVQVQVAAGSSYVVPAPGGVITSWSTNAGMAATQTLGLKVFRPTEPNRYLIVGHDGPRPLAPGVVNTFPVDIPVQTGDVIGTHVPSASGSVCFFETEAMGDVGAFNRTDVPDGGIFSVFETEPGFRLNITAAVLAPPTITAISPASGSVKGGKGVVITGTNLAEVKSVSFGAAPAAGFTVDNEGQVTAIAPASAKVSKQAIGITTVAGTATSAQAYSYKGCVVPKLKGKKLKAAKKALKKADCKLGKAKYLDGATAKTGKVKSQSPKVGKVLAPGSKVSVKLKA